MENSSPFPAGKETGLDTTLQITPKSTAIVDKGIIRDYRMIQCLAVLVGPCHNGRITSFEPRERV